MISKLSIKLFTPNNESFTTQEIPYPKGSHLKDDDRLDKAVDEFCGAYEKAYPGHEFAVRYIGRGRYNIVWIAEKVGP